MTNQLPILHFTAPIWKQAANNCIDTFFWFGSNITAMLGESLTLAIITSFCSRDLMRFASHEEGLHYRRYIVCLLDVTAAMMDGKPAAMHVSCEKDSFRN